jgi:hypothetical protein
MDAATAAPGAMPVIDWKRTSRRPIASRRSPVWGALAIASIVTFVAAFAEETGFYRDDHQFLVFRPDV